MPCGMGLSLGQNHIIAILGQSARNIRIPHSFHNFCSHALSQNCWRQSGNTDVFRRSSSCISISKFSGTLSDLASSPRDMWKFEFCGLLSQMVAKQTKGSSWFLECVTLKQDGPTILLLFSVLFFLSYYVLYRCFDDEIKMCVTHK